MKTWKLSSFDLFSLGMTIKGAWIYKELPEAPAQQAMLPDMIKFWQPKVDGPVQIIYGGYAAKIMRRK